MLKMTKQKTDITLVCFDLDDTLLLQNSWVKLNIGLGVTEKEDAWYYQQYYQGAITYDEWQETLLQLYQRHGPVPKAKIMRILQDYVLHPDAEMVVQILQERGYIPVLISGSFSVLVESVALKLAIQDYFGATTFIFNADEMLEDIEHHGDESAAKLHFLQQVVKSYNLNIEQCVCIADGANDEAMFRATGKGITWSDSPLRDIAWREIKALTDVLDLLR